MTPEQRKDLEWMRDEEREAPVSIRHAALRAALEEIDSLKARLAATSCTDCDEAEEARAKEMAELKARLAAMVVALRNAGEWVAAVDPKLPMPGTGDSQEYVLAVIDAALRAAEGRQ